MDSFGDKPTSGTPRGHEREDDAGDDSGNQPPSGILNRFAARKPTSMMRNRMHSERRAFAARPAEPFA